MEITLKSHRDYMNRMLSGMSVRDAERYSSYIEALYATEAYLVEQARKRLIQAGETDPEATKKGKSPAFAEPSPLYAFSIANAPKAVNA